MFISNFEILLTFTKNSVICSILRKFLIVCHFDLSDWTHFGCLYTAMTAWENVLEINFEMVVLSKFYWIIMITDKNLDCIDFRQEAQSFYRSDIGNVESLFKVVCPDVNSIYIIRTKMCDTLARLHNVS